MRDALAALLVLAGALPVAADPLAEYRWEKRPILVFAPAPGDPRLEDQLDRFEASRAELAERDNVVIVDTEPGSALRARFRPPEFAVILVGKDGTEKLRRASPVAVGDLTALIDSMPMRRREMRAGD